MGHAAHISDDIVSFLSFQSNTVDISLFSGPTIESDYAMTFLNILSCPKAAHKIE